MNYEWLFSFVVFADHLNFTRAARILHMTQPALHTQVRKLSEQVGAQLYRRHGRTLLLSEVGRRLAAFGREVQARDSQFLAELRGDRSRNPVVLAAGQGAFLYILGPAIKRFPKNRWPLRAISLSGPNTIEAVRDARADLGVAVLSSVPTGLACQAIRRVGQVVLLPKSHRLSARQRLTPHDLHGESIVVAPEGSPHRVMLSHALAAAGAQWSVAVETTGWELMIQFARYGIGISIVNDFCPVPRGMVGVKLGGVPQVEYYLVSRPNTSCLATKTLVRLITRDSA